MKEVVNQNTKLSTEDTNSSLSAYRMAVGTQRTSWKAISAHENKVIDKKQQNLYKSETLTKWSKSSKICVTT